MGRRFDPDRAHFRTLSIPVLADYYVYVPLRKRTEFLGVLLFALVLPILGGAPVMLHASQAEEVLLLPEFSNSTDVLNPNLETLGFAQLSKSENTQFSKNLGLNVSKAFTTSYQDPKTSRLIVKISLEFSETTTIRSETSTVLSDSEKLKIRTAALNFSTQKLAQQYGVSNITTINPLSKKSTFVLQTWEFPSLAMASSSASQIAKQKGILKVIPDRALKLQRLPNDSLYPQLWGMGAISAPAAWDKTTGSSNTVVAIMDTGIDLDHPDLLKNLWVNQGEIAGNSLDDDGNGFVDDIHGWDFVDDDAVPNDDLNPNLWGSPGHGTHVAGTIAAQGNNSIGVAGVNWSASLMALRICGPYGCYLSDFWRALIYAYNNGAVVANASFGGQYAPIPEEEEVIRSVSSAGDSPLQRGVLVIAAAGNAASNNDVVNFCPACYQNLPNLASVAATNYSGQLASFSNYGSNTVTLAAPGESILSTIPSGAFGINTLYGSISGTSMAAPHASGVATLLYSQNPGWTPIQIKNSLIKSSTQLASLSSRVRSKGLIDAAAALNITSPPEPFVTLDFKGTGSGRVIVAGRQCTSDCSFEIPEGNTLSFSALAETSNLSTFLGFEGDCIGTAAICSTTQSANGIVVSARFNGPPMTSHEAVDLESSSSVNVRVGDELLNYFENRVATSLSADGMTRARSIFRFPNGGWCAYAYSNTGGLTISRDSGMGEVEEEFWTAPYVGSSEPIGRWSNCGQFAKSLKLSGDGNLLVAHIGAAFALYDWNDPSKDWFACGSVVYKRQSDGTWTDGKIITPSNMKTCYEYQQRTTTYWSGWNNWQSTTMSHDGSKIFVAGAKRFHVMEMSGDSELSRTTVMLIDDCYVWRGQISTSRNGNLALIPVGGCKTNPNTSALLYSKTSSGWTLTKRFSDFPVDYYGTTQVALAPDGKSIAISYTNWTESNVAIYIGTGNIWTLANRLKTSERFFNFTDCHAFSSDSSKLLCSSRYVDVGNNPQQGIIVVYERAGSSWANNPFSSVLWDENGYEMQHLNLTAWDESGSVLDAAIGYFAIGDTRYPEAYMGKTFSITGTVPVNLEAPSISGSNLLNQILTAEVGTWTAAPLPNFRFLWFRCNEEDAVAPTSCSEITGATGKNYTLTTADVGKFISVRVSATNSSGTSDAYSDLTTIIGTKPSSVTNLNLVGSLTVGNSLTINPTAQGIPTPTFEFQWHSCSRKVISSQATLDNSCSAISEADERTLTLTTTLAGRFVLVQITASNTHGSVSQFSATTATTVNQAPANSSIPSITGSAAVNQTLTATKGTWSGAPTPTLKYQWYSCSNQTSTDASSCSAISGAVAISWKVPTTQAGKYIRVAEIATNTVSSTSVFSEATALIGMSPAITSGALTVTGTASVGSTLSMNNSLVWSGSPTPAVTTQWYRCNARIASALKAIPATTLCQAIPSATNETYTLTSDDRNKFISVARTGTSTSGSAVWVSPSTGRVL